MGDMTRPADPPVGPPTGPPTGPTVARTGAEPAAVTARWEDELPKLLNRLRLPALGVIQIGAHTGQEIPALAGCGFHRIVMVEPNPDHTATLRERLRQQPAPVDSRASGPPAREVVVAAAGRKRGHTTLYVTEWDQQASLLPPLPPLKVARAETIPVVPARELQHGCNVLVIDAQGAELEVLAGADLTRLQLAVIEGSTWPRYQQGSTVGSIAGYMRAHGWRQVAVWAHVRPHVYDVAWLAPAIWSGDAATGGA